MKPYFGINHHNNVTKGSFILMNTLDSFHFIQIKAMILEHFFQDLVEFYEPFHVAWTNGYGLYQSAFNMSQGQTEAMNLLFETLTNEKILDIENQIYAVYRENSPKAKALLPHKRTPFISGPQYDRITALNTLAVSIGTDADLADVKDFIIATKTELLNCYNLHVAAMKKINDTAKDLEPLRIATANALFADEGALMTHFKDNPEKIDLYFDVHSMRAANKKPNDDGGTSIALEPSQIKLLDIRFKGKETWSVSNMTEFAACLFFSDSDAVTTVPEVGTYSLDIDEPVIIDLRTIPSTYRFAYAANLDADNNGEINIEEI